MLALLLAASLITTDPPVPVSVTLNQNGRYLPGSGVQVTVHPGADGYLLVLNADPDGRVRVLFPLDPTDDAFVKGGKKYQLESRGGRNSAFVVDWSSGNGTVFAALSKDPLLPGDFALNGHWDYRNFKLDGDDDEVALRTLAERIAPGGVQYDFTQYFISSATDAVVRRCNGRGTRRRWRLLGLRLLGRRILRLGLGGKHRLGLGLGRLLGLSLVSLLSGISDLRLPGLGLSRLRLSRLSAILAIRAIPAIPAIPGTVGFRRIGNAS